jgi:DNA repair protein RadA/Sms
MAKAKQHYTCQNCSATYTQWAGKCDACGEWNTLTEESVNSGIGSGPGKKLGKGRPAKLFELSGETIEAPRIISKISEFDRVCGGGVVNGSALLVGGDPGIGKSTLLMQMAAQFSRLGHSIVYISGEESVGQIRMRAQRLEADQTDVLLATETNVENILATLDELNSKDKKPALVIIDSIQTLWSDRVDSAPGTVTQVRTATQAMIQYSKNSGTAVILVGHVTKEGQIAGPRVVEHMVDGVLYFEGDRNHQYRILRTVKNRFGATDEIGVFEMSHSGLRQVHNPSALFLGNQDQQSPGTAVFAGIEGTRPLLVEIQALVAPSPLGTPRRAVIGWDSQRLSMLLAVLEAHCGVQLGKHDVYLNIAGGYRIQEPAADMAVAAALISSLSGKPLPAQSIFFGEVGLSGATRPVNHPLSRIKEAEKLGFKRAFFPKNTKEQNLKLDIEKIEIEELSDLAGKILVDQK